jgi:hypothetical protein
MKDMFKIKLAASLVKIIQTFDIYKYIFTVKNKNK